ncbi:hypothetical protein PanWU01x14_163180 [Parasponia andersonii]|uniref:Uncharacterized protein n=1 Tax=Parasponia andersonii TaxID=3476 RepID=A0A2P5CD62_PARAD|nr:hypothetical protein PanWU01x14_163180 [Parasponia andersonii]
MELPSLISVSLKMRHYDIILKSSKSHQFSNPVFSEPSIPFPNRRKHVSSFLKRIAKLEEIFSSFEQT